MLSIVFQEEKLLTNSCRERKLKKRLRRIKFQLKIQILMKTYSKKNKTKRQYLRVLQFKVSKEICFSIKSIICISQIISAEFFDSEDIVEAIPQEEGIIYQ